MSTQTKKTFDHVSALTPSQVSALPLEERKAYYDRVLQKSDKRAIDTVFSDHGETLKKLADM